MACSTPPTYWSTGAHLSARAGSKARSSSFGIEEAQEVPRAVDERVHGVGVAQRRRAIDRVRHVHPVGGRGQRRLALRLQVETVGGRQHDRQLVERHRDQRAIGAVDDRDGRSPEALPRDQPVAQAVGLGGTTGAGGLELLDDLLDRVRLAEAVERTGVDHPAVAVQRLAGHGGVERRKVVGQDRLAVLVELEHRNRAGDGRVGVDDHAHRQARTCARSRGRAGRAPARP